VCRELRISARPLPLNVLSVVFLQKARFDSGEGMADKEFTGKQAMFIQFYAETLNATKAATLAGYSAKTAYSAGARLLKDVEIAKEIDALLAAKVMGISEVLVRLAGHARSDMGEFAYIENDKDLETHDQSHLVKKFKKKRRRFKDGAEEETIELELYDAQAALVHIGKYHKLFADRIEHSGNIDGTLNINLNDISNMSDDELRAIRES
jgi:phage terminase small subunit